MHLKTRRLFQLALGLLATTVPAFCVQAIAPPAVTPEPTYFWVIGAGAGAMLILRRMRSKK